MIQNQTPTYGAGNDTDSLGQNTRPDVGRTGGEFAPKRQRRKPRSSNRGPSKVRNGLLRIAASINEYLAADTPVFKTTTARQIRAYKGKPVVLCNRLVGETAAALGAALYHHGFFAFGNRAVLLDPVRDVLAEITPADFSGKLEEYVITARIANDREATPFAISSAQAAKILRSKQFLSALPRVDSQHLIQAPRLDEAGLLFLTKPGYDPEHRTFTSRRLQFSSDMTITEAKRALTQFFTSFPFQERSRGEAAEIAAMLTLFCDQILPEQTIVPAFIYTANRPGAGKTLLARIAQITMLGDAAASSMPNDEDELRKQLFATVLQGERVIFFDNVTETIASPALANFITATELSGRVLGQSKTISVPKKTNVFITGNNAELNADMARRSIRIELHIPEDGTRPPVSDPLDHRRIIQRRPHLLAAIYALVREWAEAGQPKANRALASFETWSEVVGGILEHSGYELPY